jgi:glycosyltransferase involved in cell wall biosynthesis
MKILVWQWGRRGAGPRFAACLADALRGRPDIEVALSLCRDAEIMAGAEAPTCEMPVRTYRGMVSFLMRLVTSPLALLFLLARLRRIRPDLAVCAMPGPLDVLMAVALRLLRARVIVIVHDADTHPGDGFPMQMVLQRMLCRLAHGLATLCGHVGVRLQTLGLAGNSRRALLPFEHPPFAFDMPVTERAPGPPRLLCFGRLLPYKGLDLLAEALASLPAAERPVVRIVGHGPDLPALDTLRGIAGVTVENRWVPEPEIGCLLAWSDALILPYREASQSGVAAAALAAGRPVIATCVGGLCEQLSAAPGALLCDPCPDSLAQAIRTWTAGPQHAPRRVDAAEAWRQAVSALLLSIDTVLPPRARPDRRRAVLDWTAGIRRRRPVTGLARPSVLR